MCPSHLGTFQVLQRHYHQARVVDEETHFFRAKSVKEAINLKNFHLLDFMCFVFEQAQEVIVGIIKHLVILRLIVLERFVILISRGSGSILFLVFLLWFIAIIIQIIFVTFVLRNFYHLLVIFFLINIINLFSG